MLNYCVIFDIRAQSHTSVCSFALNLNALYLNTSKTPCCFQLNICFETVPWVLAKPLVLVFFTKKIMWALLTLLVVFGLLLMLFTYLNRKRKPNEEIKENIKTDDECCGAHEVCERDSLLSSNFEVIYYDDEELDELAGINPAAYTEAQRDRIAYVFYTLKESDVAGWLRSLQLRNILLPDEIREEALMIVRERRTVNSPL